MKLSLVDFKNHSNSEFDLDGDVVISGRNGEGKTSILEGIIFALFGRNFYGRVACDTYIKKGALGATAILTIGGTEIKRTVGVENSVYLNGAKSKVAEAGSLFPSAEMALPVINPLYFMLEMTDVQKRELFMRLLPTIDRQDVFKKHFSKRKDMVDRFKTSTLKGIREQIRNSQAILDANLSQISTYNLDIQEKEQEIKDIRKDMPKAPSGVLEKEKEIQKQLEDVQRELGMLGNPNVQIDEYKKELESLKKRAQPIIDKLKVKNLTEAIKKIDSEVTALEKNLDEARNSITQDKVVLEQLAQFESGKCPLCNQPVGGAKERIENIKTSLESKEAEYVELKEKFTKYTRILESLKALATDVERCVNGINIHSKKVVKYDKLIEKIKEYESQLVGNNKVDFANALKRERAQEAVRLIQLDIMRKKGTIARLEETNQKLENDMPDLKVLEEALGNAGVDAYIAKDQAKAIEKLVSQYMDLEIVTVLENKSNENTREVFEVIKDGVSFRSMSFGERVKVSVALGLVLRDLIPGFNLPFVLLDEGSVMSDDTLKEVSAWLKDKDVNLIYTKASNTKLTVKKNENKAN